MYFPNKFQSQVIFDNISQRDYSSYKVQKTENKCYIGRIYNNTEGTSEELAPVM